MNPLKISKSYLNGSIAIPPSKSHSIRGILLGAMCGGTSEINNLLDSPDITQALLAAKKLGASIQKDVQKVIIKGVGGKVEIKDTEMDVGNSGQVLRFGAAFAALGNQPLILTGDHSIQTNRVIEPLLNGLKMLGGQAFSMHHNGYAPICIQGPIKAGTTTLHGEDSQPVSALLMAAAFMEGETTIFVENSGEKPWINLTLNWLTRLGVKFSHENYQKYSIHGHRHRPSFSYTVPGDFSSAAFPLVAALITHSTIMIEHVDMSDVQGDKELIHVLIKMGANIEIDQENHRLIVKKGRQLVGRTIDVNGIIDAIPILAVVGCFAEGETRLINGAIARYKESDRINIIVQELKKMGANIASTEDGLTVRPSTLVGGHVQSHHDHRIALSLIIAGLSAESPTYLSDYGCIQKSYPNFVSAMKQLGADIET